MSRPPLFIHIPKTAGTSIGESGLVITPSYKGLKPNIKKQMDMDPRGPYSVNRDFGDRMQKHLPYHYLDREYLARFDRKFSVVRNPWARVVSFYNFTDTWGIKWNPGWYAQGKISWEEYLDRMDSFVMTPNFWWQHPYDHWAIQSDSVPDNRLDFLRYENLIEDLSNYLDKEIELPFKNKSKDVDYRTYYTEEQKQRVADWFRLDIERWGFDFESGAMKNYWGEST